METRKISLLNSLGLSSITILCVVGVWAVVTANGWVRPIFLPSPQATFRALTTLVVNGQFSSALLVSFTRIFIATLLAAIVGFVVGLLSGISPVFERLLRPVVEPLRYMPASALLPLMVLWCGIGESMKIIFLFVGIAFYFIPLVHNAVRAVPNEYMQVANSFGVSGWSLIKKIYIPHALPQIFDGLIVINGLGWTYVILAELVNATNGLGYLISIAGKLGRSDQVVAGLLLIAFVAIGSDRLLKQIRTKYLFW